MAFLGLLILISLAVLSIWFLFCRRKRNKLRVRVERSFVDPRFEKVAQVFRESFESGAETGAAFAVYYKGELVVDIWGGYANRTGRIPWRENTMSTAFSTSKGINALLVAKFVELGYLDYKKPVCHYWPEFAQNGKEAITVEMLVSHQSGLIAFDTPVSLRLIKTDYAKYLSLLEIQKPFWEPGTQFGYHIFTWGYYVDALIMKADPKKRTLDQIFREEIAEPFGIDFFQGTPTEEQYRIVPRFYHQPIRYQLQLLSDMGFWNRIIHSLIDPKRYQTMAKKACADFTVITQLDTLTDYELRQIPCSSFNGHGTARAIAKLYGIIANGGVYDNKTLLEESTIKTLNQTIVEGNDVVLGAELKFGHGLIISDTPTGSRTFGHAGFGGQMGAGDQQHKVGIAYLTNNLAVFPFVDPRYLALRDAFYECLTQLENSKTSGK